VHVEIPHARRPRSASFVVVRRTTRPDPHPWQRPPFVLVSRQRAVATAARDTREQSTATALVLEAVQRRLVRLEDLRQELEIGQRAGRTLLRRAVESAEAGSWSIPEADLGRLVATSRQLPRPWFNPELFASDGTRLPRPDGWFDDVALALQVHSYRHHALPHDWDATVMGDGILVEHGVVVLTLTPHAITSRLVAGDPLAPGPRRSGAGHASPSSPERSRAVCSGPCSPPTPATACRPAWTGVSGRS
jgi:hypothetical protein